MAKELSIDIRQLKDALLKAEQAHEHWSNLLPERESLENSIQEMVGHIKAATAVLHKKQVNNPELADNLTKEIDQQQKFLEQANVKKRALDHLLDVYEECSEETIQLLRGKLIDAIIRQFPDQLDAYDHFEMERGRITVLHAELHEISQVISRLNEMLEIVLKTRQKVRRQWILGYLFGASPNLVITQQLQNAETLCEVTLTSLEKHKSGELKDSALKELHAEIKHLLKELHKLCQQRWDLKALDATFSKIAKSLTEMQESLQGHIEIVETAEHALEKKFSNWLEKYSS